MIEEEDVKSVFSYELSLIKNMDLQEKVVDVWRNAARLGNWKNLQDVPFTLLFDKPGTLIDHTKRMIKLVEAVVSQREEPVNTDYLFSGALLHDVGKLLEYEMIDGKVVKSGYGEKFRHPVIGAKLAWKHELPDEVVHIIYAHSHEGDKTQRSLEAIIVHHCDFIDFEIRKTMGTS